MFPCAEAPYEVSLFERLQSAGSRCTLLTTQYRMHPAIRAFPSAHFYGDRLCDAVSIAARPLVLADSLSLECHPRDLLRVHSGDVQFNLSPYRFLDVRWSSEQYGSGGSTHNRLEASVVAAVVSGLVKALTAGVPVRDGDGLIDFRQFHLGGSDGGHRAAFSVGVITPYSAQRQLIGEELSRRGVPEDAYEVNTVDAFQGREMDAIVLSTVRAAREGNTGPGGTIGFVSDRRRMNVALTRARHCLLIVGDSQTLEARSEDWRQLIVDAKKRNCFEVVEKDGKSPGKVGPLRKGGGGPEDRSGGEGRGGGGSRQGAAKRQLDMGGGKKGEDELGGEKRKKLGGGLDGGVAGATKKRPEKAANGKRKELLGPAEKAEGITSVAAEPPKKKKKSSGKGDPQRGGLTGEGGSSAAEKGRSEAKDKEKKEGRKNGREKEETEKQTGRKGAATSGEGGKTENGLTEAAALLVTPPGGVKESRDNSPPKQSARGAEGPVSGGVDGQGGPVPHSILNRASSESETKSKVRMNVRLAKQVHFQEPGQLVQVRYIPRVKQEGAEDDGKEGPGKKPGRKRELTFQTFVDLKKGRKQWVGKAAPADGRLLKAGRNGSKVEGSSEGSKAKPGESPTTGAGSASRKDVLKQSGLKKTSRKGAAGQGALKGTLPLAAVVGKKK